MGRTAPRSRTYRCCNGPLGCMGLPMSESVNRQRWSVGPDYPPTRAEDVHRKRRSGAAAAVRVKGRAAQAGPAVPSCAAYFLPNQSVSTNHAMLNGTIVKASPESPSPNTPISVYDHAPT